MARLLRLLRDPVGEWITTEARDNRFVGEGVKSCPRAGCGRPPCPVRRNLDQWTRRRLRAIVWKQWKRVPTRFAELRRCGVGRDLAAQTAGSPTWPLAAQQQSRAHLCPTKCLLHLARLCSPRGSQGTLIYRTAVYGPVCTVVWEGSREADPYPDFRCHSMSMRGCPRSNDVGAAITQRGRVFVRGRRRRCPPRATPTQAGKT